MAEFSEEHRRKLSEAAKRRWQDPEYRKEMTKIEVSENVRAILSNKMKERWSDPEYRKQHTGIKASEEKKRKISDKAKERWSDPDFKTLMSETMKASIAERGCSEETRIKLSMAVKERLKDPGYRKQMSENLKKKWEDPEYRKRILKAREGLQLGEKHPMWGKKHSKESRAKMSESHNDYQSGEGHPMYGKHHSKQTRKQLSESHKGVPLSEKHRASIGKASKKIWATIDEEKKNEWRQKIGAGNRGKVVSDEARKKISIAKKGKRASPATEFKKGMKHSRDHLEYMSKVMSTLWRDPKYIKKMAKALRITPNKPETFMINLLNDLYPGEWKFTGDFSFMINGKCPDFVNCNGQKKCIEIFGNYWHKGEDPQDRIDMFNPFGYETLVIWEHELKDVDSVVKRIHDFMVI